MFSHIKNLSYQAFFGFMILAGNLSLAGQETRGGGSGVNDGIFRLADMYFQREGEVQVKLGLELVADLQDVINWVVKDLKQVEFKNIENTLFGKYWEYRFVNDLPVECRFIEREEIDPIVRATLDHIGCTVGYITFIKPDKFLSLSKNEQSLFLLHERLHNLGPNAIYDVKVEIIKALGIYMEKIRPALRGSEEPAELTPKEISVLESLPTRIRQLATVRLDSEIEPTILLRFLPSGAYFMVHMHYENPEIDFQCENCLLGAGTKIEIFRCFRTYLADCDYEDPHSRLSDNDPQPTKLSPFSPKPLGPSKLSINIKNSKLLRSKIFMVAQRANTEIKIKNSNIVDSGFWLPRGSSAQKINLELDSARLKNLNLRLKVMTNGRNGYPIYLQQEIHKFENWNAIHESPVWLDRCFYFTKSQKIVTVSNAQNQYRLLNVKPKNMEINDCPLDQI